MKDEPGKETNQAERQSGDEDDVDCGVDNDEAQRTNKGGLGEHALKKKCFPSGIA